MKVSNSSPLTSTRTWSEGGRERVVLLLTTRGTCVVRRFYIALLKRRLRLLSPLEAPPVVTTNTHCLQHLYKTQTSGSRQTVWQTPSKNMYKPDLNMW